MREVVLWITVTAQTDWGGCFRFRADEYTEEHNTDVASVKTETGVLTPAEWNTDTALISAGLFRCVWNLSRFAFSAKQGIYNEV